MRRVFIEYNPYKLKTNVLIDGKPVAEDSFFNVGEKRLQEWIDDLPYKLSEEFASKEFQLTFSGTSLDYEDIQYAAEAGENAGVRVVCSFQNGAEPTEKLNDIRQLFEKMKNLGFSEFQEPGFIEAIERLLSSDFEVNVIATVSAGKSTLINALLRKKLMPSENQACTSIIVKIKDTGAENFSAKVLDDNGNIIEQIDNLDLEAMCRLNSLSNVSEIHISGNIPFLASNGITLVLVDTPGTNNARTKLHKARAYNVIDKGDKSLIVFVINATNNGVTDETTLLQEVAEKMKENGKLSRDRFLFAVNRVDKYAGESQNLRNSLLPKILDDLEKLGINNASIFPVSALVALGSYYQFKREMGFTNQDTGAARDMCDISELHLEKAGEYVNAHISHHEAKKIASRLEAAAAEDDMHGMALVHSGVLNLEAAVREYVDKYARAQKLRDTAKKMQQVFEAVKAESKLKETLLLDDRKKMLVLSQIQTLKDKINAANRGKDCKRRIDAMDISGKAVELVKEITSKTIAMINQKQSSEKFDKMRNTTIQTEEQRETIDRFSALFRIISGFFEGIYYNMINEVLSMNSLTRAEINVVLKDFEKFSTEMEAKLRSDFSAIIDDNVKKGTEGLLTEYKESIKGFASKSDLDALRFDPLIFMQGAFETVINLEEYITTETTTKTIDNPKKKGFFGGLKFWQPDTLTETTKTSSMNWESFCENTFDKFSDHIIALGDEAIKCAKYNEKTIRSNFNDLYKEMDEVLKKKLKDLEYLLKDNKKREEKINSIQALIAKVHDFSEELEAILEL
jgi:GTPase Era involved in 16S rRNA processing